MLAADRRYGIVLTAKLRPHRRALDAGVLSEEISRDIMLGDDETVVIDWENVTDQDGNVPPYNLQNFKKGHEADLPDVVVDRASPTTSATLAEESSDG